MKFVGKYLVKKFFLIRRICNYVNAVSYTHLAGGIATMPGVLIGIFIVGFIYNGINMIGINANWQSIIRGLVIIGTVMMDMVINGKARK